jgi:capsular polysaccharide export protein
MRILSDAAERLGRRQVLPGAACAVLFPELAATPRVRLAEGVLRAPPRGPRRPPLLSACAVQGCSLPGARTAIPIADRILAERGWEAPALLARAAEARRAFVAARIGGNWWCAAPPDSPGRVAAVVALAEPGFAGFAPSEAARPQTAAAMLDAALSASPADRVVVLAPARPGRGIRQLLDRARRAGAAVIAGDCDPWPLLDRAERIYSAGGEIGFLALLAGVAVSAFAPAVYTGWGATEDAPGVKRRKFGRSIDEIFAGICLVATRYRDPFRNEATGFEEALAIGAEWRRIELANRRIAVCVGMSFWKRQRIAEFARSTTGAPVFRRTAAGALAAARAQPGGKPGAIAAWASRLPDGLAEAAARDGMPLIRVEDGFIRSVGLGSDFLPPASLVFDSLGMYFDPRRGSDLECLLRDSDFSPALLARAEWLRARLVERGIT